MLSRLHGLPPGTRLATPPIHELFMRPMLACREPTAMFDREDGSGSIPIRVDSTFYERGQLFTSGTINAKTSFAAVVLLAVDPNRQTAVVED